LTLVIVTSPLNLSALSFCSLNTWKAVFYFIFPFFFFFSVLGTELRALHLTGKCSSTELNPQLLRVLF
jgi:hypothetical protein